MLQNYKAVKRTRSKPDDITDESDLLNSTDKSESTEQSCDNNEPKDDKNEPKDTPVTASGLSQEEEMEYKMLTALYDIISAYLQDYCHILFVVRFVFYSGRIRIFNIKCC